MNDFEMPSYVVEEAARLFNRLGYWADTLRVIDHELGLRLPANDPSGDGERLVVAAFEFAADAADRVLEEAVDGATTTTDQLKGLVRGFRRLVDDPPIEGGSPVFHAALSSHSGFPFLHARARTVVSGWRRMVRRIVRRGIKLGEIRPSVQPEEIASIIVGTMEGATFLHRVYDDASHLDRSVNHLLAFLDREVAA